MTEPNDLLTDEIRTIARSMITTSLANMLDDYLFDEYLTSIISMVLTKVQPKIEQARRDDRKEVVNWIGRNAICSHEPSYENIRIDRKEWTTLSKGKIPTERKHIKIKRK